MDNKNKEIFENYLTTHYSKCEKTNFNNDNEIFSLLNQNEKPIAYNLGHLFEAKIKKESKILDLGCGYGSFLNFLQLRGYKNVTGVDISAEEVSVCRRFFKSYKLCQEDIFDYTHNTKEKVDVVYLSHVLEHIRKDQLFDFLGSVRNILNEGGFLIIVVPNSAAYFNSLATRYGDMTHEIGFTDNSLEQILMVTKFKNIEIKNFFGVGNFWLNIVRKVTIFLFGIFVQILGYDKQEIYTPSILVIAKK